MVVHGFLRTEEEQCGGNSHSRDASTNNDESIFITVTNCHKKHTLTVTLPPAFPPARRRAPPTSLTHTLAPPTPTPTPNATPHSMRVPKHVKILVTQFKRPHCTRRKPANDITLTQMSRVCLCVCMCVCARALKGRRKLSAFVDVVAAHTEPPPLLIKWLRL
jgi:hypothetical protein